MCRHGYLERRGRLLRSHSQAIEFYREITYDCGKFVKMGSGLDRSLFEEYIETME